MPLGETLRSARLAKKLATSEVAMATRMKVQVVDALEREDFSQIPAVIYAKGFIRLYAEHVGLDPHPLIEEYVARFTRPPEPPHPEPEDEPEEVLTDDNSEEMPDHSFWNRMRSAFKSSDAVATPDHQDAAVAEERPATSIPTPVVKPVQETSSDQTQTAPVARSHARSRHNTDHGPDLFSRLEAPAARTPDRDEPAQETPEEQKENPIQSALEGARVQLARLGVFARAKTGQFKIWCIRLWKGCIAKCVSAGGKLKHTLNRVRARLPEWKLFELSTKSLPVMIVVIIIVILLISGLTSMVRRQKTEKIAEPAVETQERLRITVEPPSPYYK